MSQPFETYPYNPVIKSQPESSHSDGSYATVFIVLAVICAVGVAACVYGWLCNRPSHRDEGAEKHHHHHPPPPPAALPKSNGHELGPKEWEAKEKPRISLRERADVEFGFDTRFPPARGAGYGGGMAEPPHFGGGRRPEVRFADNV
ncbi:uncharacterized protein LOC131025292 [Salvia miltiorrhiza]|uniref:uncharacterized protein LOC131025292 n=1 Tax=Salvia miltiorrhiza TaxID=226208 RepID=UPI0025ACBB82|nr:uncharacterized protein LOC131025292 [Salvia miltiorrhiza]